MNIRFSWLGTPVIELDGIPVHLETRKTSALLAYVILSKQSIPREVLADVFWPDFDKKHTLANLRRSLFSINHSFGHEILISQGGAVGVNENKPIWVDVHEFRRQLNTVQSHTHANQTVCQECLAALERAVGLYRGEFLAGLNLPDCPEFDEWQYFQREGFKQALARGLEQLAEGYAAQAKWEQATGHARRWVGLDRLNEVSQRTLMDLYFRSGLRSAALRQYESLTALLEEELGQPPEDETVELYERIQTGEAYGRVSERNAQAPSESPPGREPLIKTKLLIPPLRTKRVPRPRLVETLNAGCQRTLTLISAPVGFGKTTLLVHWTTQTSQPVAWFSIDEGDNDPVRFLTYLVAALDSVVPSLAQEFQNAYPSLQANLQPVLIELINHLAAVDKPFTLVLDDYHFIRSPEVHRSVEFLVEKIPAAMHIVLASRADPPFPLGRLRARDQLGEIRADELRFTPDESGEFLQQVMSLDLTREDVLALGSRTEGWIAGLQMAGLAIGSITRDPHPTSSRTDVSGFIRAFSGSHRYILDYLGEEVLNRQPEEIQQFLLRTSILGRMCGPLCEALIKDEGKMAGSSIIHHPSSFILDFLERSNLFLVPLDNERCWYRYHHLFQEQLRYRMEEAISRSTGSGPEAGFNLEELHLRAANWFEEHGYLNEAIHHLLAAEQFVRAASLIEGQVNSMLFIQNQAFTLLEWLAALPAEQFQLRPRLSVARAWALILQNQYQAGQAALDAAQEALNDRQDSEETGIAGEIALARGVFSELSERNATVMREQALQAWEKLPQGQRMLRGLAAWLLGVSYYHDGDALQAKEYLSRAVQLCREAGNVYFTLVSIGDFAGALRELGRYREAYSVLTRTEQEMTAGGLQPHPSLGSLYLFTGQILYQWNQLEAAEHHLNRGIRLVKQGLPEEMLIFGIATLPYVRLAQGRTDEAMRLAEECLERVESYPLPYLPPLIRASLLRFWIMTGRRDRIEEWILNCALDPEGAITYTNETEYASLAKAWTWQGRSEEALKMVDRLAEYARIRGRNGKLFRILVLQALALQKRGDLEAALAALEESLKLAQPEGYIRAYLEEGEPMEALLQLGIEQGRWALSHLDGYVDRLMAAFRLDHLLLAGQLRPGDGGEGLSEGEYGRKR